MKQLVFNENNFLSLFNLPKVSYSEFCDQIQILDISDKSGTFKTKQKLDDFILRVSKKDNRIKRLEEFKGKLYQILVIDIEKNLKEWFLSHGHLSKNLEHYFNIPHHDILENKIFSGRVNSSYGKLCKNINFINFYNTKKWYLNDSEYVFGLLKVMVEEFKLRNSLVGPAFFDQICKYTGSSSSFWRAFMMGANRPSIFNPATYKGILDELFVGETLFAPVMGWNSYQLAFYNSKFKKFISTDVIESVVKNGDLLHKEFVKYTNNNLFSIDDKKEIDLFCCPSEQLKYNSDFMNKYSGKIDSILFSPPYFDLEIYDSENQSITTFPNYDDWLIGYWEETILLCKQLLKNNGRLGFVISNYRNSNKVVTNISQDLKKLTEQHLNFVDHYKVQWNAMGGSRQAKKTRNGNFEDLWLFERH